MLESRRTHRNLDSWRLGETFTFLAVNEDQEMALIQYFRHKAHLHYSAPTGHGKSLVYQAIPLVADHLIDLAAGTCNVLVICPLLSLMHDQVASLRSKGIASAAIFQGQEESVLKDIEDNIFSVVYASPKSLLSSKRMRELLTCSTFAEYCVGIAIDEAHCITQW